MPTGTTATLKNTDTTTQTKTPPTNPGQFSQDDADAITQAIEAAVTKGKEDGSDYAEVILSKRYFAERAPVAGGGTKGNAQIPLPIVAPEDNKFTLVLRGLVDGTAGPHWHQTVPQQNWAIIDSMLTESHKSSEWGAASVIGGPTFYKDPNGGTSFSNMLLVTDGITIRQQKDPPVIGCDTRQVAQHNVIKMSTMVRATVAELVAAGVPTNEFGIGLYLPLCSNNDNSNVDWYTCYGHYYGPIGADHLVAERLELIACARYLGLVGLENQGAGLEAHEGAQHGMCIKYLSVEGEAECYIEILGGNECRFPIMIALMAVEGKSSIADIQDPGHVGYGEINWENIWPEVRKPTVNGATNLRIVNQMQPRGNVAPPTAAELEAGLLNPYWRDAFITIENAEQVEVDGVAQLIPAAGDAASVMLPTNKTIKVKAVAGEEVKSVWTLF